MVDNCQIYRNAGWGIHIYNESALLADKNIVRNNEICNNAEAGFRGPGVGIYSGKNNLVYNNLIWENAKGIEVGNDASDSGIYNNTIYKNRDYGIDLESDSYDTRVINNIFYLNGGDNINNNGNGSILKNNFKDTDPLLQDPDNGDFYPKSNSKTIDAGVNLTEFSTDADGRIRPNGNLWDIGAYEYYPDRYSGYPAEIQNLKIEN